MRYFPRLQVGWLHPDIDRYLTENRFVFGVDTSSVNIDGDTWSVTVLSRVRRVERKGEWRYEAKPFIGTYFNDEGFHPEKFGWCFAISVIQKVLNNNNDYAALFTDHDMNLIPKINHGDIKIVGKTYLHPRIRIHYAKDKGIYAGNWAVRSCDKTASYVLKKYDWSQFEKQFIFPRMFSELRPLGNILDSEALVFTPAKKGPLDHMCISKGIRYEDLEFFRPDNVEEGC